MSEPTYMKFADWLARNDAEVAAKALEDAADAAQDDPEFRDPLRLKSDWLRARAEAIRNPEPADTEEGDR